jgi:hypothetical protein
VKSEFDPGWRGQRRPIRHYFDCLIEVRSYRLQPALQGLLRDGLIRQVAGGYALG